MNISFVLDVAIALIFIYLILSLLASEIQELLATVLQWRAAHLKKSIEILLTGGEGTKNDRQVKEIVQQLYDNPLIKNISQESKEGVEAWLRQLTRSIVIFGRKSHQITLKGNEPSYMPSETFATTLLERLNLPQLAQKMTALNLQKMIKEEIILKIESYVSDGNLQITEETRYTLKNEAEGFKQRINSIRADFCHRKATLLTSVNRLRDELDSFIAISQLLAPISVQHYTHGEHTGDPQVATFITQLKSLKNAIFYQGNPSYHNDHYNSTDELLRRLQPSLAQILDLLVGEVKNKHSKLERVNEAYKSFKEEFCNLDNNDDIYKAYQAIEQDIINIRDRLPNSVRESFAALARRAQVNLKRTQAHEQAIAEEIHQFQTEIQVWFDSSMERASGVYKRNAKGVAFAIGFLLAIILNADTFHIISRLRTDSALRDMLVKNGELTTQACLGSTNSGRLECFRQEVNQTIPLPIGRDATNLKQQAQESENWLFPPLRSFLGWVVSGLAIAMGAPFWFELLGKIINVRNSGKPPVKSSVHPSAE
ncbi:hypothetical protein QUB80_02940 [Chlorogloeopsis sp. ULAP01]|uniref:hypothetical protein n=1 Tax=Chlorogloeopsis sp. ULAP01 TaxID=3056483 RepID=UPI0025AAF40A|nr:hypothetical protein [Chlorogloeopsis sp. ULAP01]MDM9379659.1 hypothetical protein [Chlorogloeopsis sp. ULAP01]